MDRAKRVVRDLFEAYANNPAEMQAGQANRALPTMEDTQSLQRTIADYVSGMTDRFAAKEHQRLTGMRLLG
jgi:dGTPase